MCENMNIKGLAGIIDTSLTKANEYTKKRYIDLISIVTRAGNVAWNEYINEDYELYTAVLENMDITAYLCYDASVEEAYLYIEDLETKVYALYGKEWEDKIGDIYANMVTVVGFDCWDKDTEVIDGNDSFIEDVNYNSQILGEMIQIFKLNINYNNEMLGA